MGYGNEMNFFSVSVEGFVRSFFGSYLGNGFIRLDSFLFYLFS